MSKLPDTRKLEDQRTLGSDDTAGVLVFEWGIACFVFGLPAYAVASLYQDNRLSTMDWRVWLLFAIFLSTGTWLFWKIARKTLDRLLHGKVALHLEGPARAGGSLKGHLEVGPVGQNGLKATLSCESTRWTRQVRQNGDDTREVDIEQTDAILWKITHTLVSDAAGWLQIVFNLPGHLPGTDYPGYFGQGKGITPGYLYHRWRLHLSAPAGTVDFDRYIDLPVAAAAPGTVATALEPSPSSPFDFGEAVVVSPQPVGAPSRPAPAGKPMDPYAAPGSVPNGRQSLALLLRDSRARLALAGVALLIAVAGGVYRFAPGLLPADLAMQAGLARRADLAPSFVIDLDHGGLANDAGTDLWWHFVKADERYLEAKNGAAFARISARAGESDQTNVDTMDAAQLATLDYSLRSLAAQGPDAELRDGARFVVRTSEGKYARLHITRIDGAPGRHLQLEWMLIATTQQADAGGKVLVRDWRSHLDKAREALRDKRPEDARRMADEALASAEAEGAGEAQLALALHGAAKIASSANDLPTAIARMTRAAELIDKIPPEKVHRLVGRDDAYLAADIHRLLGIYLGWQGRREAYLQESLKARQAFELAPKVTGKYPGTTILMQHSILLNVGHAQCALRNKAATLTAIREAHAAIAKDPGMAGNARGDLEEIAKIEAGRRCGD